MFISENLDLLIIPDLTAFIMASIPTFQTIDSSGFIRAYNETGCFIVKKLLDKEKLREVLEYVEELTNIKFPEMRECLSFPNTHGHLLTAIKKDSNFQKALYDVICKSDVMHRLSVSDEICFIVRVILSPLISHHSKKLLLISVPGEKWHLARWHQDAYYNGLPEDACTIYAPLQKTNIHNGGLTLALNSHKAGLFEHSHFLKNTKWNTIDVQKLKEIYPLVNISMEIGDVLFMHGLLAHSANENKSKEVRLVANFRYQNLKNKEFVSADWDSGDLSEARNALMRQQ